MTVGDTLGNAKALVNTVAQTVQKMDELSVGDTRGGAQALVDALADTLTEVEALITDDTLGDAYALNDLLGCTYRHSGQCEGSGRHAGRHGTRDGGVVSIRTRGGAQALGDALGDTEAEMEGLTPGDTLADANALYDLLSNSWPYTGRRRGSGQQSG